jgi:CRISPR-associated protein Cas2
MFVAITYDVQANRTEVFRKILTRFLTHEQNSVFMGDLTEASWKKLRASLSSAMIPGDRILKLEAKNKHNVSVSNLKKNAGNGAFEEIAVLHHEKSSLIL